MNLSTFLRGQREVQRQNRGLVLAVVLLAGTHLLAWWRDDAQAVAVILTPPTLTQPVRVARNQADAPYKMAWGLFVAQLLGNVTPGSGELVLPALEPLLDATLYQPVRLGINEQLRQLRQEQISVSFAPRDTQYEATRAKTIDESASAEVAGEVVYFASYGEAPVTLYLTPALARDLERLQTGQSTSLWDALAQQRAELTQELNQWREVQEAIRRQGRAETRPVAPEPAPKPLPTLPVITPPAPPAPATGTRPAPPSVSPLMPPATPIPLFPVALPTNPSLTPSLTGQPAAPKGPPKIRVLSAIADRATGTPATATTATATTTARRPGTPAQGRSSANASDLFLPVSILSGTLLTGMDAPTGRSAQSNPLPALLRLKHEAILPNHHRLDIRECFLVAAGYGDLSAERAYLRGETISCTGSTGFGSLVRSGQCTGPPGSILSGSGRGHVPRDRGRCRSPDRFCCTPGHQSGGAVTAWVQESFGDREKRCLTGM